MAAPPVAITDPADPRLRDYRALTDVELRRAREPEEGLFVAEGEKVVRRALAAGYPMRSLLLEERWVEGLADVVAATPAPVYVAPRPLLEQVTGYLVHRGALAAMHRLPLPPAAALLAGARLVLVLEDLVDHTNVGSVFRSAAALGVDAVLLTPRCADPLYRRSVKVSMGAVLSVPHARLGSWPGALAELRAAGLRVLALTPAPGAVSLRDLDPAGLGPCALLLGSEGPGLSEPALAAADLRVRIPTTAGVDSLNVAAAAAIACYALTGDGPRGGAGPDPPAPLRPAGPRRAT